MLRTFDHNVIEDYRRTYRLAGIAVFTLLVAIAARISIPMEPVPFTMQPLVVLLAGMVLGWRDGALSQLAYVSLIALNFPIDANGIGSAALSSPTVGYLIGFIFAAGVVGWLVQFAGERFWQRWLAGIVGVVVIYAFGFVVLKFNTGMDWGAAWKAGVTPFIGLDLIKAVVAAGLTESGRRLLLRTLNPSHE